MQSGWPAYAGWMLAAGMGIPILAMATGSLGTRIGNAPAAAAISLALACTVAVTVAAFTGGPVKGMLLSAPLPYYFAGVFMGFYLVSISFVAPRFGLGNAIFFVLFGQIVAATLIDHFGLFGADRTPVDRMRLIGIALMAVGVFLARKA